MKASTAARVQRTILPRRDSVVRIQRGGGYHSRQRVLFLNEKTETIVLIDIDDPGANDYRMTLPEFCDLIRSKQAEAIPDPFMFLHRKEPLSEASQRELEWRLKVMSPYLRASRATRFSHKGKAELIRQMCDPLAPFHCSKPQAYRLVRTYLQRGQFDEAVRPDHWKAGYTAKRRQEHPPKRRDGRDRKAHTHEKRRAGIPLTWAQRLAIRAEVIKLRDTRAKNGRKPTWREVRTRICNKFFPGPTLKVVGTKAVTVSLPDDQCPSAKQLQNLYYLSSNPEAAAIAREGERLFKLTMRARLGDQRDLAYGPLEVVQIDFTVADIYLLDFKKKRLVGRPTLVLVKDTFSRLIVGFAVSWGRESWVVATLAFLNMVCDKVEYCAQFGRLITEDMWASGMFETALTDNGALHTRLTNHFRSGLHLDFDHTPSGRGDQKPVVESSIRDINELLIHTLDGSVIRCNDSREMKKRIKHAKQTALYNLQEFIGLVVDYIIDYNNNRVLMDYPLSDDMVGEVAPIPIRLWHYGVDGNRSGRVYHPSIDLVRMHCLCEGTARVDESGINFRGKSYECERAKSEGWFVKAKQHPWHIPILYHPSDLSIIYIKNPDASPTDVEHLLEPCVRLGREGDTVHISFYENEWYQVERAETNRSASQLTMQTDTLFRASISERRREAIASKPGGLAPVPVETKEAMSALRNQEHARELGSVHDTFPQSSQKKPPARDDGTVFDALASAHRAYRRDQLSQRRT